MSATWCRSASTPGGAATDDSAGRRDAHVPRPPVVISRQVIAALARAGFVHVKQEGSHLKMRHPDGRIAILVDYGDRDYPLGTLRTALTQAGLSLSEFRRLLKAGAMSQYVVVLTPDESGGFVVSAPALPGCVTHGDTVEAAIANAREAIALYRDGEDAASLAAAGVQAAVIFASVDVPARV